ncbi:unnamed protein product [Closterium sp. NIES-65]|nr:unnamed protein product [Closterium sp. NIES-65]
MWSRGGASVAPVGKPAAYGARAPMAAAAVPETHEGVEVGAVALNAVQRRNARVSAGDRVPVGRWVVAIATGGSDRVAAGRGAVGERGEGERVPMGERGEGERVPVGERGEGERVPVGERGEGERVPVGERGEDRVPVGRFVPPPMNFELQTTTLEIDFHSKGRARAEQLDAAELTKDVLKRFAGQVLTVGQTISFEFHGTNFALTIILLDAAELSKDVLKRFAGQVLTVGQKVSFEFRGTNFALTVILVEFPAPEGQEGARAFTSTRGLLVKQTGIIYEAAAGSGIKTSQKISFEFRGTNFALTVILVEFPPPEGQEGARAFTSTRGLLVKQTGIIYEAAAGSGIKVPNRYCQSLLLFKQKDFNLEKLGIGGNDAQFSHPCLPIPCRLLRRLKSHPCLPIPCRAPPLSVVNQRAGGAKAASLFKQKDFNFEKLGVVNQRTGGGKAAALFKQKDFNFEKLGIGGLDAQFADIFRRAFASRVFPPHIISR